VPSPGVPALLRELNDRTAVALLAEHGPMSRFELAQATGLSKPTAVEILRRLESAGLVRAAGERSGARGPNALVSALITERFRAVAVDIQGRCVRSTVVDIGRAPFPVVTHVMSDDEAVEDAARMLDAAVERACAAASADRASIVAVAAGLQASVDHRSDSLSFLDEMPGWPRSGVAAALAEALGVPVLLENDANLAATAERAGGAGREAAGFALLWLADGVGLALDLDGAVHTGASGAAGEIGYLEAGDVTIGELVSGDAVAQLAEEYHAPDPASLPAEHPFHRALAARVGAAILPALAVADPGLVILHGPSGIAGGAPLAEATQRWLAERTRWSVPVVPPAVVESPVLDGARHRLRAHVLAAMQAAVA